MKAVVISCWAYRDAWLPFFALLQKFWPAHPRPAVLLTDELRESMELPGVQVVCGPKSQPARTWCQILADYAHVQQEPILLFQEDFFLNAPVREDLIRHALMEMDSRKAGAVRLYPCPGADSDYGDSYVGIVRRQTDYRISCQATIWRPRFLYSIASRYQTPAEFEIQGSVYAAAALNEAVLAWKRDAEPWPLQYLCSAISRGKWSQDARRLCEAHGIPADFSMRETQPA